MATLTTTQINAITATLSATRLATFEVAPGFSAGTSSLEKYSWHALTSAAFFASLHICEVAVRNGVNEALVATCGPHWPWNSTFERSLPAPRGNYFNPKSELLRARGKVPNRATGKVVAELAFAFWCHLFTSRYQVRVWDTNIRSAFPNMPITHSAAQARQRMHIELDSLRKFRNRIAHHEPILADPFSHREASILSIIKWRNSELSDWHIAWETVTEQLAAKP